MDAATGPFLAAAGLLVLAGGQKVLDPSSLRRALLSVGLRLPAPVVRSVAAFEVLLGIAALLTTHPVAAVGVLLSYVGFTAFVLVARQRGGVLASCGCFGKADTPPTFTHAAVTAGLALSAGLVAVGPREVGLSPALVVASVAVGVTAYLVLAVLPQVQASVPARVQAR